MTEFGTYSENFTILIILLLTKEKERKHPSKKKFRPAAREKQTRVKE
jgi:hypothetical protein